MRKERDTASDAQENVTSRTSNVRLIAFCAVGLVSGIIGGIIAGIVASISIILCAFSFGLGGAIVGFTINEVLDELKAGMIGMFLGLILSGALALAGWLYACDAHPVRQHWEGPIMVAVSGLIPGAIFGVLFKKWRRQNSRSSG